MPSEKPGSRSSSPTPKRGKGIIVEPTPDVPLSPRRSPRKPATAAPAAVSSSPVSRFPSVQERLKVMGPLPTNKSLFKGIVFLITSGTKEQKKRRALSFGRSLFTWSSSTDESGVEEETEVSPIDKNYATEQIQHGGGVVLASFDKSQTTKCKVYLISNTYTRTSKYFQALAAGIPCLSHLWVRDCINSDKILTYDAYLLPAGIGLDDKTILEQQPQRCILAGMHIYVVSNIIENQEAWRSVLLAAGCKVVKRLPTQLQKKGVAFACNVIVTDYTCPKHIIEKAVQLSIPVVSLEWLMQSLINSRRFPYKDSYKFAWDWQDTS
ncbi:TP53-binding protein 1-like [Amphiura filiformis]|uniref:TP53-binding protein 1-like n=1 Tax=Amphiura filiformis TaxID=82378 RepID=UPI003B223019